MKSDDGRDPGSPISGSQVQSATAGGGTASLGNPGGAAAAPPSWLSLAGAVGGAAGATAVVYAVGGVVMLMRLNAAGVQANQALGAIPQQTLFAVGADQLLLPAIATASLYAFFLFLDRQAKKKAEARPADEPPSSNNVETDLDGINSDPEREIEVLDTPGRGRRFFSSLGHGLVQFWRSRFGQILRRGLRWLLAPLRWYFRFVPDILLAWIPIFIFLPNPGQNVMTFIAATGGAGIVEWAEQTSATRREFALRSAIALAVLTTAVGLGDELVHPHALPNVEIGRPKGASDSAKFVAVSGGNAYIVKDEKLVVLPSSSYTELTVTGSDTKASHEKSIFNRIWP